MNEERPKGNHQVRTKAKTPSGPDPKRPYHVGVAVGLTTGLYAASLLVTARLQIATDRGLIEDRTPVEAAISSLGDHHERMDDRLGEARAQYAIGATGYEALRARLATLDQHLTALGQLVDVVDTLGAALPAALDLPGVPATTRSSSGGSKPGGQSVSGPSKPKPPPAVPAAPAPPPPTGGTSGASGAP